MICGAFRRLAGRPRILCEIREARRVSRPRLHCRGVVGMFKRALFLFLLTAASLSFLHCGGQKEEDALMEDESSKTASTAAPAAPAGAAAPAPATGGATVTGKVNFDGTPPQMAAIKMDADAYCKAEHKEPV